MPEPETRAGYIEGLRALAAALEQHPGIPLPSDGTQGRPLNIAFYGYGSDEEGTPREQLAAAARAMPCDTWAKSTSSNGQWFELTGALAGGLHIQLYTSRDAVCTRRVTGVEEQEVEEVVTPAVTRKVTKPVEVVEWDCGPVLRKALDTAPGPAPDLDLVLSRACRDGGHGACVNDNDSPQCAYPCECPCHAAACASCGATTDLQPVHDTGGDGTVSYYCANTGACGRRRQHAVKAAAVAQ